MTAIINTRKSPNLLVKGVWIEIVAFVFSIKLNYNV